MAKANTKTDSSKTITTMEGQGKFTSRLNATNGHIRAQHFIELLEHLHESVDNFPEPEKLWTVIDTETLEARRAKINKQVKRSKTRTTKYKPKHIAKPKLPINLYRAEYKKQVIANGGKFDTDTFNQVWHELDDATKQKYQDIYQEQMEVYNKEYTKAMEQAIIAGEYEEKEPKKPASAYILFNKFSRMEGNTIVTTKEYKFIKSNPLNVVSKYISSIYDVLKTDESFMEKMNDTRASYQKLYEYQYAKWNIRRLEGLIKKCEREDKTTRSYQKELDAYRESITISLDTEPVVDISWINKFKRSKSTVKATKSATTTADETSTCDETTSDECTTTEPETAPEPVQVKEVNSTKKSSKKRATKSSK